VAVVKPTADAIQQAGKSLAAGRLVVIPTETVYGLACDALDAQAVLRVFRLKGRPPENPLIVHLADADGIGSVAVPSALAKELGERFWPGPLTLVLPKRPEVPYETTGGLDTVAVRVPAHPVARAVIRAARRPVAAPSANPFKALSPTRAEDVDDEIVRQVDAVLDGGPCEIGIESTVVDLTGPDPIVLRPGGVPRGELQAALGRPLGSLTPPDRRSPGLYKRHYAPSARLVLVEAIGPGAAGLTFGEPEHAGQVEMPLDPAGYAVRLYSALRRLDAMGFTEIQVEEPPDGPEWEAVWDRLRKASAAR
jgi:L-threonylcarbamoyladenylate synthase